jgi:hypothetical protein
MIPTHIPALKIPPIISHPAKRNITGKMTTNLIKISFHILTPFRFNKESKKTESNSRIQSTSKEFVSINNKTIYG